MALQSPSQTLRALGPRERVVWLSVATALLAALALLAAAPKPWSSGVSLERSLVGDLSPLHYLLTWGWLALAGNALVLAALLATARVWLDLTPAPRVEALAPPARRASPWWAALVLAAMGTGGALAAPRLTQSLWDDEVYNVVHNIDGQWQRGEDGELTFRRRSWIETLWDYPKPNNHVPNTVLARLSLGAWRSLGPDREHRMDERSIRLPAFAAAVASIGLVAVLVRRMGFAAAGVVAAWLLALHPWTTRYASEARGYGLVLLFVSLHPLLLIACLRRGSWPRWLCYGACQVVALWVYPTLFSLLAVGNLAGLGMLVALHSGSAQLRIQLIRFALVQVVGAGLFLQLMAPNLPQLAHYLGQPKFQGDQGARFLQEAGSYLLAGMPWKRPQALGPHYPQLLDPVRGAVPPAYQVAGALALALLALGALRLARSGLGRGWLLPVLLLPGPVFLLLAELSRTILWEWYLIFVLPSLGALIALGTTWPLDTARSTRARLAAGAAVLAVLIGFAAATAPARQTLRGRSLQPRRESVALTRPRLPADDPAQDRVLTVSFSVSPRYYDPRVLEPTNVAELRALMARADREGRALYVNIGWLPMARRATPELVELVLREDLFQELALLHGFEPRLSRQVLRYRGSRPGSAGGDPGD